MKKILYFNDGWQLIGRVEKARQEGLLILRKIFNNILRVQYAGYEEAYPQFFKDCDIVIINGEVDTQSNLEEKENMRSYLYTIINKAVMMKKKIILINFSNLQKPIDNCFCFENVRQITEEQWTNLLE